MKSNNNSTPYLSSEDILKNDFFDDEEQYVEPTTEQIAAAKKLCPDNPPGCLVEILGRQYKNNILNKHVYGLCLIKGKKTIVITFTS